VFIPKIRVHPRKRSFASLSIRFCSVVVWKVSTARLDRMTLLSNPISSEKLLAVVANNGELFDVLVLSPSLALNLLFSFKLFRRTGGWWACEHDGSQDG
jgi:hypothetical protein